MGLSRQARYYLVCAVGFAFALLAYRFQWGYSDLPAAFAADQLAYPVTVAGFEAATPERLRFVVESWPPGSDLAVTDAGGGVHALTTGRHQRLGRPNHFAPGAPKWNRMARFLGDTGSDGTWADRPPTMPLR